MSPSFLGPTAVPSQANPPLLTQLHAKLRLGHFSLRTEQAYTAWVRRFIRFHRMRHPAALREPEVEAFLRDLSDRARVSPSTQAQALAAILFLYRVVLGIELRIEGRIPRARAPRRLPVVLTRGEVGRVLGQLEGVYRLVGWMLYGSGMRLMECLSLRVKDVDLERAEVRIRRGKGAKDRVTVLPGGLVGVLAGHLDRVRGRHEADLAAGAGWVELPGALARKYPSAGRSWPWQWIFSGGPGVRGSGDRPAPATSSA